MEGLYKAYENVLLTENNCAVLPFTLINDWSIITPSVTHTVPKCTRLVHYPVHVLEKETVYDLKTLIVALPVTVHVCSAVNPLIDTEVL